MFSNTPCHTSAARGMHVERCEPHKCKAQASGKSSGFSCLDPPEKKANLPESHEKRLDLRILGEGPWGLWDKLPAEHEPEL